MAVTEQTMLIGEAMPAPAVGRWVCPSDRWSARLFGVVVVVALPLLLWFERHRWFFLDEWWVLTRDGLTSPGYLDAHNGHWITVLRFDYRLNFELRGLRSYLPYQIPVVLAHLCAAVLLRQVIRRLGVRGWIATCVALAFLFFGSGGDAAGVVRRRGLFGGDAQQLHERVCRPAGRHRREVRMHAGRDQPSRPGRGVRRLRPGPAAGPCDAATELARSGRHGVRLRPHTADTRLRTSSGP